MILRKPYAVFIKYFKLLHVLLAGLVGLILYRSFTIYSFFRTYVDDYRVALADFDARNIINFYSFLNVMIIIIVSIVLLSVMIYKNKPKFLYIYNIALYIGVAILYGICYSTFVNINAAVLDIRFSKAIGDFALIACILQALSLILILVRATGFDIKRFDFGTDLQALDIDEKDSEEIEVSLEFDKNKASRNLRKNIRNFRYVYVENKFVINTSLIIALVVIAFLIYFNIGIYNVSYKQGAAFSASNYMMNIKSSYILQTDPKGKKIVADEDVIVAVKLDIKKIGINETFNTGLVTLRVGNSSYGQNSNLAKQLYDLGSNYVDQELTDEYRPYILAFSIPKSLSSKKMTLRINDNVSYVKGELGAQSIMVDLAPIDLNKDGQAFDAKLGETIDFNDSILGSSSFQIKSFNVLDKSKVEYNFCYAEGKCFPSYEYVTPTASGNYYKTLLRIDGSLKMDLSANVPDINSMVSFMNAFGTINYKINDKWYSSKINSQIVKPKIGKETGIYYIEVINDVKKASNIYLTFNVRNMTYTYNLK